jgi:CubicO group peptidase (beta-lactamase class C family)
MTSSRPSPARLAGLHDALAAHVGRAAVLGLVAAVARGGEPHVEVIGSADAEGTRPLARDAIFRISSMTKPVTAVAALVLVEEGAIRLDDPVDALLPELADRRVLRDIDGPLDDTVPARRPIAGARPADYCVSVVTRRDGPAAPVGQYGWDGGLGSIWRNDPSVDMTAILLTNAMWSSPQPQPPPVAQDFLTAAYAAIDG